MYLHCPVSLSVITHFFVFFVFWGLFVLFVCLYLNWGSYKFLYNYALCNNYIFCMIYIYVSIFNYLLHVHVCTKLNEETKGTVREIFKIMSVLLNLISLKLIFFNLLVFIYLRDQFRPIYRYSLNSCLASISRGLDHHLLPVKSFL